MSTKTAFVIFPNQLFKDTTALAGVDEVYLVEENLFFKEFKFKNYADSETFILNVGKIAESEGHHPDINFGWGYANIKITTHAIEGISENDFILAAKIDQLTNV